MLAIPRRVISWRTSLRYLHQRRALRRACPVDCIHPKKDEPKFEELKHLMIDPEACIDCGACVPVCPDQFDLHGGRAAADQQQFAAANAAYYGK